jgi:hypothetical protein
MSLIQSHPFFSRVETRTKDGVVKGKYGYVDANGQLKVMEYTAGEKTEDDQPAEEEEDEAAPGTPSRIRPGAANTPIPNYRSGPLPPAGPTIAASPASLQSRALPPFKAFPTGRSVSSSSDQSISAQTPTATSVKLSRQAEQQKEQQEERDETDREEAEDDDEGNGARDVNNGQYFRSVPSQQGGQERPSPLAGQGQQEGPRYVPTHLIPGQGQRQQFPGFQSQYAPQPQQPQQYQPGGALPQGFGSLSQGPQQPQQGQQQGGFPITAYPGGQFADEDDNSLYSRGQPQQPQGFGRPDPNVQIQFRGSPAPSQYSRQPGGNQLLQSPYAQGGLGGGQPEQGGFPLSFGQPQREGARGLPQQQGVVEDQQQQYVPNSELDGYSEDADEDGFVDTRPGGGLKGQAQEKQGVAVKAVGTGRATPTAGPYTPNILGPQGVLQGGRQQPQQPQFNFGLGGGQPGGQPGPNPFLGGAGAGGQPGPNPFLGGSGARGQPQLTEEQFQRFLQQQNEQFNANPQQGLSPQTQPDLQGQLPGRGAFGGIPGQLGQGGFPQGFSQQQQPQFLGGGPGGLPGGRQQQQRPNQFPGQPVQNPLLQGQFPQGQGQPQQFAGLSPQQQQQFSSEGLGGGRPQQGQFLGGQQGQFLGQDGQFLGQQPGQGIQGQYLSPDEQQYLGQQGQGQFSQGLSPQGFQSGSGRPQSQQQQPGGVQSNGFPFDFNPFGGSPGQFQGNPGQFSLGGQQGGGLSPSQLQALQAQGGLGGQGFQQGQGFPPGALQGGGGFPPGQQGGFGAPGQPGGQGGFAQAQQAGYVPGRFPGGDIQQQQVPQLSLGQRPQGQSIGRGIQLRGGPRPVQAGSSGSSSVIGSEASKKLASSGASSSSSKPSSN